MPQRGPLSARKAEPKGVERLFDEPGGVPEEAEKSVGGASVDGNDGQECMVLRGRGGGRAVEFDVAARGEPGPAVERNDHRRVDAQELARGGKGDEVGFGTVAARGVRKCTIGARKGRLGPVRKEENLRAECVDSFFRGGEGGGEIGREQNVVFKDERGEDVLLDHAAVDGVV